MTPRLTFCRFGSRAAAGASLLALAACTTDPGPALDEAVPDIDRRAGLELGTMVGIGDRPWNQVDERWDGASPLAGVLAVDLAVANNRALRRIVLEVERRRALTRDAQLAPNPTLNFAGGIPVDMGVVPLLAMVGQQVDWLWKRDALVGDADAQLRSLLFEAAAVAVATATEARAAYVSAAAAQEIDALARRDVEVASRILQASIAAFDAGDVSQQRVNDARMNATEAQNRAMEATTGLVDARTRLLLAIGRGDGSTDWTTVDTGAIAARRALALPDAPLPDGHDAVLALVRERRLDLRAADARVIGARARLALAEAARIPSVMLGAGWERDMESDQSVMLQAQVTLPIWNDGRFRVEAARHDLEIALLDADDLWQRAVADTVRALAAVAATEHHEATLREGMLAAYSDNKAVLEAAVDAGERPAMVLWASEHQENHIRLQLARAERDRALAALTLERTLTGTRLPAMGAAAPMAGDSGGGMGMGGLGPVQNFDFTALETFQ
jgi:outer membrane protein TolC